MADNVNNDVETKPIGFAPILQHYFHKCRIVDIIDQNVPLDARRKMLTHGQASIAMITTILLFGIGNLELLITRHIIETFEIQTEICHNDTTCAQVYGENNKNRSEQSIKINGQSQVTISNRFICKRLIE